MSEFSAPAARPQRLADRLESARRRNFVGRAAELELFRQALQESEPSFAVLYIYGPGGIGKSTLLREYARIAQEAGLPCLLLDGRNVEPTPVGFLQCVSPGRGTDEEPAAGEPASIAPWEAFERFQPGVLLIDTYETLAPLDFWLRETFFPQLPGACRVVIAGRNPPDTGWRTAPGWESLLRTIALRNLRPEESRNYLSTRGVPNNQHDSLLGITHGHPLALSLAGDLAAQSAQAGPAGFRLDDHPQVLRTLLERFAQQSPSSAHRLALEASVQARVTSEPMLSRVLQSDDVRDVFQWLSGLSFIEHGPEGLFPHDLAREVLDADTRWRNPEQYAALHKRIRDWIIERLVATSGKEQQRSFMDLLYLHRNNPLMRPFYDWKSSGSAFAETATAEDYPAILEMLRRHEGDESVSIARYWLERQPRAFTIFRGAGEPRLGFCVSLMLTEPSEADFAADPAIRPVWDYVQRYGALRAGEKILYHRFWCGSEAYQEISATQNLIAVTSSTLWLSTPQLAWSFLMIADPEYYRAMFTYLNMRLTPEANFTAGGRAFAVFGHDWRAEPPLAWIDHVAERELDYNLNWEDLEATAIQPLLVLSQPDFEESVRQALRDYPRQVVLAGNPLLRSRLVSTHAAQQPVQALRALMLDAVNALKGSPKDEKMHRALWVTYIEPAPTQEAAAERLDLPFSTYRYHLAAGVEKVTAWLWQRELYGEAQAG